MEMALRNFAACSIQPETSHIQEGKGRPLFSKWPFTLSLLHPSKATYLFSGHQHKLELSITDKKDKLLHFLFVQINCFLEILNRTKLK